MRGSPISIRLFRFLLVLAVAFVCLSVPPRIQTVVFALTVCVGLWLFSALCVDAKAIRRALEESDRGQIPFRESHFVVGESKNTASSSLMDGISSRKLGDRVFKADESKTCRSCQSFEPEGPLCRLDDESLAGITLSAVGCQHWSPGLKVAERPYDEET